LTNSGSTTVLSHGLVKPAFCISCFGFRTKNCKLDYGICSNYLHLVVMKAAIRYTVFLCCSYCASTHEAGVMTLVMSIITALGMLKKYCQQFLRYKPFLPGLTPTNMSRHGPTHLTFYCSVLYHLKYQNKNLCFHIFNLFVLIFWAELLEIRNITSSAAMCSHFCRLPFFKFECLEKICVKKRVK